MPGAGEPRRATLSMLRALFHGSGTGQVSSGVRCLERICSFANKLWLRVGPRAVRSLQPHFVHSPSPAATVAQKLLMTVRSSFDPLAARHAMVGHGCLPP